MRVLITTNHLRNFAGSEMVTLELIEHFLARGWAVDVYTHDLGDPMLAEIQRLPSWGRLTLHVANLDARFDDHYDLVWVQHSILPPGLLDRLEKNGLNAPMVWNHMSTFMDVELPRYAGIEGRLASVVLGMSGMTCESLRSFGIPGDKLMVFDNPAPDVFADFPTRPIVRLQRLLVVSNHAPVEVREAALLLGERGVDVSFLGVDDRPVRILPQVLSGFDAVLTIGKTVQYSLSMGIPVYLYDHFGGPGWLGPDNLDPVAHDSFSGRKEQRHLSADRIAAEVIEGFPEALDFTSRNRPVHAERWRLSRRVEELLVDGRVTSGTVAQLSAYEARQLTSLIALHRDLYRLVIKLQDDIRALHA